MKAQTKQWVKIKYLIKKNIIIGLTVIALIGVGVWYYYYYSGNGAGNGGNNLPTQGNPPFDIGIVDNQTGNEIDPTTLTDAQRLDLVDRADRLRNAGRLTGAEHQNILNRLLPPAPSYEAPPTVITSTEALATNTETVASITDTIDSNTDVIAPNTENSASTSRLNRELDRFFPINGDNSTASGSGSGSSSSVEGLPSNIETLNTEASTEVPTIEVVSPSPIERSSVSETPMGGTERPQSPAGSDDSSETIRNYTYGDPGERPRFALPRGPFDQNNRRNN